ncbi:MAG: acetyl-CoA carboxylase biotin carboxylase subunit [Candidatus Omnitrophica bacterium]|nr:acetyl-CoA carboxylase biotin carboxylase subunit [Candidatus Omnitrophota bacterium]
MFSRILVANRGEVAVRIIRACREMGIQTVAVFSKADRNSLHVRLADEAICVGEPPSAESYLNIPSIISAAEIADVEAIHPGYGFLAENAHFAEICESCQIKFIGPSAEVIRLMGDKSLARETMRKHGIPVIAGSESVLQSQDEAFKIAKKIGYPVIVKARAGGGGKGLRVAHNESSLSSALHTAQAEAQSAFGDRGVYIERYIREPRHIEVQVFGDAHGHMIHMGERDCTIQRRHQKLLEEAPSPSLSDKVRKRICETAVKIAKAVDYVNAGTIEFLVDEKDNFYFMEMNTRLQVEHPVTEITTGIDIVKWQIRVAAGEKLAINQDEVRVRGAAIECRINAEDPDENFRPSPGKIETLMFPGGPGVRVDSHIYTGYEVPPYYDSMIAKIICWGRDRREAIRVMQRVLGEFEIGPIKTTAALHMRILTRPLFIRGRVSTKFVDVVLKPKNPVDKI